MCVNVWKENLTASIISTFKDYWKVHFWGHSLEQGSPNL